MTNNTALYVNRRQASNWREQGRADAIDGFPPPLHWPLQYAEGYAKYVGIQYTLETRGQHKPIVGCDCSRCIRFYKSGELPLIVWRCDCDELDYHAMAYSASAAVLRVVEFAIRYKASRRKLHHVQVETPVAYSDKQIEELFSNVSKVQP